ncbi:MAG: hypothetical protein L6413_00390, partial [Coriobacteriia bacterium]|nr:hypothetical protein [Coriobacteriia bacterium]
RFHGMWPDLTAALAKTPSARPLQALGKGERLGYASLAAGAMGTGLLYATWLFSTATELNWTLPSPGVLNVFGYWHLLFFGVLSVWFWAFFLRAGTLLYAVARLDKASCDTQLRAALSRIWPELTAVVASLVLFSLLLMSDYRSYLGDFAGGGWTWWFGLAIALVSLSTTTFAFVRAVGQPNLDKLACKPDQNYSALRLPATQAVTYIGILMLVVAGWFVASSWSAVVGWRGVLLAPLALAALAAWNFQTALYAMQGRALSRVGRFVVATVFVVLFSGYGAGLASAMALLPDKMTAWSEFATVVPTTLASAVIATLAAWALAPLCIVVEESLPDSDWEILGVHTILDSPESEIAQNFAQFLLMQVFLLAPMAMFRTRVLGFMIEANPSEVTQLFYGYAALVGVAITFPLSQNMSWVREIKTAALESGEPGSIEKAKHRGDYYTMLTIGVGVITLIEIGWSWVLVLIATTS